MISIESSTEAPDEGFFSGLPGLRDGTFSKDVPQIDGNLPIHEMLRADGHAARILDHLAAANVTKAVELEALSTGRQIQANAVQQF